MTNGEKIQSIFPNMNFGTLAQDDVIVNRDYSNNDEPQVFIPVKVWNAEYKESNTKNDLEIVIDAMEYRTNSLIENIKSEILHFANAHCSGDDINIYDVFKVIDDCCEAENLTTKNNLSSELEKNSKKLEKGTTKNDLALIHTEGLDEGIRCAMCTNSIKSERGCDGGCVVNNAMYKEVMDVIENHIVDTDKMVGPTTENDLAVDAVSRQAINGYIDYILSHGMGKKKSFDFIKKFVANMSSVTPQESRWISVIERLPDTDDEVLCWYEYYHWSQEKVLPEYGLGWYSKETKAWCGEVANGRDVRVIAWMPLPKAYSEVEK